MKKHEWSIRQMKGGDEGQLRKLVELVFKRRLSKEYWDWEFRNNPAGSAQTLVAVVGEKVVGQYAVIPMKMRVNGKTIVATLGVDAMTHPDYRRQGMWVMLANALYEQLGKSGFPITYAFPNEASAPVVFNKLQWTHVCSLPMYLRPLNISKIIGRFSSGNTFVSSLAEILKPLANAYFKRERICRKSEYKVKWIKKFDDRVNSLWEKVSRKYRIAVIRDRIYLNWRYFGNPERDYKVITVEKTGSLLGYMVLRCLKRFGLQGGMIVDFLVPHDKEDIFHILIHEALSFFGKENMDLSACMIHGDYRYLKWLKKNKFILLPQKIGFKKWYFGTRLTNNTLEKNIIDNASNWFLNFGDTDVI